MSEATVNKHMDHSHKRHVASHRDRHEGQDVGRSEQARHDRPHQIPDPHASKIPTSASTQEGNSSETANQSMTTEVATAVEVEDDHVHKKRRSRQILGGNGFV